MARYKNGINGAFSGKVGSVVGAKNRGVNYMRSLPDFARKEATEKQRKQRNVFGIVSRWLRPLKDFIKVSVQFVSQGRTAMNEITGLIIKEAIAEVNGELKIDFKRVILGKGELLVSYILEFSCISSTVLQIKWSNAVESALNRADDSAVFIFYNPEKDRFLVLKNAAMRKDKVANLTMPTTFEGDLVHCWMQYVNAEGNKTSSSIYVGEVLLIG